MQVWWRTHLSFWHHVNGRYDQSAAVIAEAREIAERYGLAAYLFEIDHAVASALISKGDYAAARRAAAGDGAPALAGPPHGLGLFPSPAREPRAAARAFRQRGEGRRAGGRARPRNRPARRCRCRISSRASRTAASRRAIAKAACAPWTRRSRRRPTSTARPSSSSASSCRSTRTSTPAKRSARPSVSPPCWRDYRARGQVVFLRNRPDLAARLANLRARGTASKPNSCAR